MTTRSSTRRVSPFAGTWNVIFIGPTVFLTCAGSTSFFKHGFAALDFDIQRVERSGVDRATKNPRAFFVDVLRQIDRCGRRRQLFPAALPKHEPRLWADEDFIDRDIELGEIVDRFAMVFELYFQHALVVVGSARRQGEKTKSDQEAARSNGDQRFHFFIEASH